MIEPDAATTADPLSDEVTVWLMRCYETQESWKQKARDVLMASNGDSVLSRTRVAAMVRRYFLEENPEPEDVERWKEDYEGTTKVHVEPPKVSASNAGYVDWLYVADYLLLGARISKSTQKKTNAERLNSSSYGAHTNFASLFTLHAI